MTNDEARETARAITMAEHAVVDLMTALAEADEIAKPNQRRNTDGIKDLRAQLPKMLAKMSPEARRSLANEVGGMFDALAFVYRLAHVTRQS